MRRIFQYYAGFGHHTRESHLSSQNFARLLRDCEVLDATDQLSAAETDVLFVEYAGIAPLFFRFCVMVVVVHEPEPHLSGGDCVM